MQPVIVIDVLRLLLRVGPLRLKPDLPDHPESRNIHCRVHQAANVESCTKTGDTYVTLPPQPDSYSATVVMAFARQKYATTRQVNDVGLRDKMQYRRLHI